MKTPITPVMIAIVFLAMFSIFSPARAEAGPDYLKEKPDSSPVATFAGGCFWCIESEFRPLPGVLFTIVGYTQGKTQNPTYDDVSTGDTGHAEALEIYSPIPGHCIVEPVVLQMLRLCHSPLLSVENYNGQY